MHELGYGPKGWVLFGVASMFAAGACSLVTPLDGLASGQGGAASSTPPDDASTSGQLDAPLSPPDPPSPDAQSPDAPSLDGPSLHDALSPLDASAFDAPSPDTAPPGCVAGALLCNGACVDPASDPHNCNGCGNVCASGLCGSAVAASLASPPTGWTFNGSATYNGSAPSAQLTPPSKFDQAGTFLYANPIVVDAFHVVFQFRIGLQGGSRSDGMGFVIEQSGPTAVGLKGGGLGMAGLSGYGVELDIFNNARCGDTNGDHVGVDDLSPCSADPGDPSPIFASGDLSATVDLADTHWHTADVVLAGGAISVQIDGAGVASGVSLPGFSAGAAYYFGFAGGTGGLLAADGGAGGFRQEVKNVAITFPTPRCL